MSLRNVQIPSNLTSELGVPQIIDITDDLPKLKKKGKPDGWDGLNPPRQLEALTDIAWHHSAVFRTEEGNAEKHANNHIRAGEGGCPYHFLLVDGQWYQCNDLLTFTYGVSNNNYQTVHVCVEGCFSPKRDKVTGAITRPADQLSGRNKSAMIALELTLRQLLPSYKQSKGHNYYKPTECPGFSMTKFTEEVATLENKLAFSNTEAGLNERAFKMANVVLYYYNMAQGKDEHGNPVTPGNQKWAQQRLLLLEPAMKEHGFV